MRTSLLLLSLVAAVPALADPLPIAADPFPAIVSQGLSVALKPFVTIPPDAPGSAKARITTAVTDGAGRLFISDLNGTIYRTNGAGQAPSAYLELNAQGIGAASTGDFFSVGLAGVAFHPNFAGNPALPGYGKFYTTSTTPNTGTSTLGNGAGPVNVDIREWTTANPAAPTFTGTSRSVLTISGYDDTHSNGFIGFNPNAKPGTADYGNLYIGSGDGLYNDGNRNAQNLAVPQGKMLRIDPLQSGSAPYTIPADNPFIATPGALPEVWASGLRYPQSFTWDTGGTGQLFINDIGQANIEEVNLGVAGANYGWSQREGTFATGDAYGHDRTDENIYPLPPGAAAAVYTDPIGEYYHSEGAAIGSGLLYRGTGIPSLYGKYLLEDIVTGRLLYFDPMTATAGSPATLYQLDLYQNGAPIDLYGAYYPRADTRLSLDLNGEPIILSKASGEVFSLTAMTDVPEPAALPLVAASLLMLGLRRRR